MTRTSAFLAAGIAWALSTSVSAVTLLYPNFSSTAGLQLNGATTTASAFGQTGLRLTTGLGSAGSAFSTTPIALTASASFSTSFSFAITNPVGASDTDGIGADGLVFVVQTVSSSVGGGGGGIGFFGIPNSVGIEFDTWNNGVGAGDPNGNHVGIDTNGNLFSLQTASVATRMNDGNIWYAWVDYDGSTNTLEVRLSQSATRPASPLLTRNINLSSILGGSNAFVGFTSGTGAAGGDHFILSWEFRDVFNPVGGTSPPPPPAQIPVWTPLGLLVTVVLVAGIARRRLASGRR